MSKMINLLKISAVSIVNKECGEKSYYLDQVGAAMYIVSQDETPLLSFDDFDEAKEYYDRRN